MAEYIEKEKIKAIIRELPLLRPIADAWCSIVDDLPAADARPVVKAHWTDHRTIEHDGEWYCSNCGNEVTICMCGKDETRYYPYCPNCGADMREES